MLNLTFGLRFEESWKGKDEFECCVVVKTSEPLVANKCNTQVNDTKLLTLTQNETRGSIEFGINKVVERKTNSSRVIARLEDDTCSR